MQIQGLELWTDLSFSLRKHQLIEHLVKFREVTRNKGRYDGLAIYT